MATLTRLAAVRLWTADINACSDIGATPKEVNMAFRRTYSDIEDSEWFKNDDGTWRTFLDTAERDGIAHTIVMARGGS